MSNRKVFKLSLIAAACMAASAPVFSGVIVGGPQSEPSGDTQGFGGFNLGNVEVKIVNVEDGSDTTKVFNEDTGLYDMTYGETFVSPISDKVSPEVGTVTGNLHGKDWPVGEPSGIKVITAANIDDTLSHNRPASCIMSTSYFLYSEIVGNTTEGGWLDSMALYGTAPNPTLCGSPFQTHKRFKIDAITPTADAIAADPTALAEPIDVVINVDATSVETATRRYMVLQKLNNYSDRRYSGYKVEVGFGVGAGFVNATTAGVATNNLSLSIGTGEDDTDPLDIKDIWAADDLATFSAGLFGTADDKHPADGFFDTRRAGYYVGLDANATTISSTTAFDSNYTPIFGNWLPSKWEPAAIFYDDDQNPLTDASLVAFWGDNPNTVEEDYTWLQGNATGFAPATMDQLYYWSNDTGMPDGTTQYAMGSIEDVLNLGLTYIVNLGDVSTFPLDGAEIPAPVTDFTIRMTPIVDATDDGTVPGWIANPAIAPVDIVPADYVPTAPEEEVTTTTTSSGGSASVMDNAGMIVTLLISLGLGGWLVSRKLSK